MHQAAMPGSRYEGQEGVPYSGGLSRGPITEAGRLRCAAAKTKHGLDTRHRRAEVSAGLFYLRRWGEASA